MREYLSVNREINAIRLRRSTFSGTFLLVEGNTDKIFYSRFFEEGACTVVVPSGKPSSKLRVLETLRGLEKENFQGVLAIVDADFDRLECDLPVSPNLIQTDTHDLETMLIGSPALEKVIYEFGIRSDDEQSMEKMKIFIRGIRKKLLQSGKIIGYLRWISLQESLNLKFEKIVFNRFIDEKTLKINIENLVQEIKNKSNAHTIDSRSIQQKIIDKATVNHDLWQVCCGHDLVEILALALRTIGSKKDRSDVRPENLKISLRLAYEEIFFFQTQVYSQLRTWERDHSSFKVLRSNS